MLIAEAAPGGPVKVAVALAVTFEAADNEVDVGPDELAFRLGSVTRRKSSGIGSFPDNNLCSLVNYCCKFL